LINNNKPPDVSGRFFVDEPRHNQNRKVKEKTEAFDNNEGGLLVPTCSGNIWVPLPRKWAANEKQFKYTNASMEGGTRYGKI
jgi:hypothetical protein